MTVYRDHALSVLDHVEVGEVLKTAQLNFQAVLEQAGLSIISTGSVSVDEASDGACVQTMIRFGTGLEEARAYLFIRCSGDDRHFLRTHCGFSVHREAYGDIKAENLVISESVMFYAGKAGLPADDLDGLIARARGKLLSAEDGPFPAFRLNAFARMLQARIAP